MATGFLTNEREQFYDGGRNDDNHYRVGVSVNGSVGGRVIEFCSTTGTLVLKFGSARNDISDRVIKNIVTNAFEKLGMKHTITKTDNDWFIEFPNKRSYKVYHGMGIQLSARQFITAIRTFGYPWTDRFKNSLAN